MNCKNQVATIAKFVNGGYGLAHDDDGTALFARFGLPGETVSINITERRKKALFGHVVKVHEPYPGRIEPPCPYYGRCGGCDLQHVSYGHQCSLKLQIVTELVSSASSRAIRSAVKSIQPIRKSPQEMNYRQRIRLAIDQKGRIGFRHFRSNEIVAIDSCLLAVPPINHCLKQLRECRDFIQLSRLSEQAELSYNPLSEKVSALLTLTRPPRPTDRNHAKALTRSIDVLDRVFFRGQQFALEGPHTDSHADADAPPDRLIGFEVDTGRSLMLNWEVGGFSQVNLDQNRYMIDLVTHLAAPGSEDRVLDLFCGMGNFSLPLALRAAEVHGVENQGSAIRSGKRNCERNGITNCRLQKSDVESACRRLVEAKRPFDIVICDPPRRGLANLVPLIASLTAGKLIYISCDPATLCRDLAVFTENDLQVSSIHPVDMFPQTHHIETVVALGKLP